MAAATKMQYVRLSQNCGLKVSKVILGAMSFGVKKWAPWVLEEEEAIKIIDHAYKQGINTWDTANIYSYGESERILGKYLKTSKVDRSSVVILSKCYGFVGDEKEETYTLDNRKGLSRKHIFDAVDASVERLGTYIDVLQIHRLDRETPKEEIMRALNDVVESGKVRYIGASSMYTWEFQQLQNIAERNGWHKFVSMQGFYNLTYREEEREMIPYCKDAGIGLIPWSPLSMGLLARPWSQQDTTRESEGTSSFWLKEMRKVEATKTIVDRVEEIAKKKDVPMAAVAVAWNLKKGTIPIVGLSSEKRVDEVVAASTVELTEEEEKFLEEPYQPRAVVGH